MAALGTEAQIRDALLSRLESLSLSPPLPVAWPDTPFTKPISGDTPPKPLPYLEAFYDGSSATPVTIAHDGLNRYLGLLLITVCYPQGAGIIKPGNIAGAVAQHFKRGIKMSSGDTTVQIIVPPLVAGTYRDPDGPYTRTIVTIRYQALARQ